MKQIKNTELLSSIREAFKKLRADKGVTQETVSNDIQNLKGVTISIGRIETGDNDLSVSTISILCEYYGVSISEFFGKVEAAL